MDFDYAWKEPSEAQIAALQHAHRCLGGKDGTLPEQRLWHAIVVGEANRRAHMVDNDHFDYKLNEFDLAEMMLTADRSLWFTQAQSWAEEPPGEYGPDYQRIAQLASRTVRAVVEWGYQDGKWWDLESIFPDTAVRALAITSLLEFNRLLYEVTHVRTETEAVWEILSQEGGSPLVSAGWQTLPLLLVPRLDIKRITRLLATPDHPPSARAALLEVAAHFDPEVRKQLLAARRDAKRTIHETYEPTECVHPECLNLVAPTSIKPREGHYKNYRGTGACRRGHNSYFCTKCQAPHSFVSKIGRRHYPEHYGKDWDGLDMEGNKWSAPR